MLNNTESHARGPRGADLCSLGTSCLSVRLSNLRGMASSGSNSGGGFAGLIVLLVIAAIIVKFIWWILGAAALVALGFLGRAIHRRYSRRLAADARYRHGLAARADQQHNWVLRGDDRGVYGTQGAQLMHYIFPNRGKGGPMR